MERLIGPYNLGGLPLWIPMSVFAMLLAGLKGYWLHRTAQQVGNHHFVGLLSSIVTIASGALFLVVQMPATPAAPELVTLTALGGIGYMLSFVLSSAAQSKLSPANFQAGMKLATFLPLPFFLYVLGDPWPSVEQWTGIAAATLPLVLVSRMAGGDDGDVSLSGLLALGGAVFAVAGQQIINKLAVDDRFDLHIDKMFFLVAVNAIAAMTLMASIALRGERLVRPSKVVQAGLVAGFLNFSSFSLYLEALRIGPASVVVTINSFHAVASTMLTVALERRAGRLAIAFIVLWSLGCIFLLSRGGS